MAFITSAYAPKNTMSHISGFHRMSIDERRQALLALSSQDTLSRLFVGNTDDITPYLDGMSENVVGAFCHPLSVLTSVSVNAQSRPVALVTEEPSVVAAANAASALFERCGGVNTRYCQPVTSAQIVLVADDPMQAMDFSARLSSMRDKWLHIANASDPGLVAASGGAFDIAFECMNRAGYERTFIVGTLDVHTVDIMGANAVNTMAEAILSAIEHEFLRATPPPAVERLMAILTNASPGRIVKATISLPFEALDQYKKNVSGQVLAQKLEEASQLALVCPQRAVTHNKGILNGIFAAATPLAQDTRAMAASAIDFACQSGSHKPLAVWQIHENALQGNLTMPIVAGCVGGASHATPAIAAAFELAHIHSYEDLCGVLTAIGLAQNFAALAALVTEGIQAGHMKLHARKNFL